VREHKVKMVMKKQNNQTNYQNDAMDTVCNIMSIAIESAICSIKYLITCRKENDKKNTNEKIIDKQRWQAMQHETNRLKASNDAACTVFAGQQVKSFSL